MSLYSPPVGATAGRKRVEHRLRHDRPREQAVDVAPLPWHPYRVIGGRQDDAGVSGHVEDEAGDADVTGLDDERALDARNDDDRQRPGEVGLSVDELYHVKVGRDYGQRQVDVRW